MSRLLTINKAIIGGIFLSLLLLANSFAWAATTEDVESFNDNYPGLSTEALLRLVVKGDELAQHEWGNRLALGASGAPANRSAAAMWYSRAAQRGTPGSASLSSLPNAPLRVDRTAAVASASTVSAPPSVQLADPTESVYELTRTIDGSASSSSQSITHYIWDVWSDSDQSANITDLGAGQAQVIFPNHGTWFVTLIILDASGQIDHQTQTHTILEPLPPAPTAPELNAPSADQIVQSTTQVTFSWLLADSADSYEFEIFTNTQDAESPINVIAQQTLNSADCQSNACAVAAEINAATGSEIFWRVRASNTGGASDWIDSRILIVAPATSIPAEPITVFPISFGSVNSGLPTEFVWEHDEQVETFDFAFYNNVSREFFYVERDLRAFDLCSDGLCKYETSVDLPVANRHSWRLRAMNSLGNSSLSQTYFNAVVPVSDPPAIPTLATPQHQLVIESGQSTTFSWDRVPTASIYEFQIVDTADATFDGINAFIQDANCGADLCSTNIDIDFPVADTYEWQVRATNSAGSSEFTSRAFSVIAMATEAPVPVATLSPYSGSDLVIGSEVVFEWQRDTNAVLYDFYLYDNVTKTNSIALTDIVASSICSNALCTVTQTVNVSPGVSNQWRVRAKNSLDDSGLSQSFFTAIEPYTQAPETFALLSPVVSEDVVQNTDVTFSWAIAERAESYEIYLPAADGSTITTSVLNNNCDLAQCSYTTNINLPVADDYEWQVSAINSVGQTLSSSSTFSVVLEIVVPPAAPTLTLPVVNASFDVYSTINFEWQAVADATSYDFYLTDGTDDTVTAQAELQASDVCVAGVCSTSIDQDLNVSDAHTWHVRAKENDVESEWSQRGFAVIAPTAPALVTPLASAEFEAQDTVDFRWSEVESASSYDFLLTDGNTGALPPLNNLDSAEHCVDSVCSVSVTLNLTLSESHSWQVRAKRQDVTSEWSERNLVVVPPTAPVALFSMLGYDGSNATKTGPLSITFDPSASSDDNDLIQTYEWDFGDGSSTVNSTSPDTQTHTYTTPGSYTVSLTVTDDAGLFDEKTASITVLTAGTPATGVEAARLLTQATFGPTLTDIEQVKSMGINNWIDWQLSLKGAPHLDYVQIHSNGSGRGPRHEVWWADVVEGDDQLRQRVAFALSQIFVISDTGFTLANAQYPVTNYYDILRDYSFGNFRELLEEVTLNPVMGLYLSMLQNAKGQEDGSTRADENYAREILQLFSIGLHDLNLDGTTDGSPSFNQDQIEAFARVFTGWNYADAGNWDRALSTGADMISQMLPFEEYHDTDEKILLNGVVAPAGNTARQDLELALDNIFQHQNVGPFIGKQLIKRLVTSNPSPGYVSRVSQVFNDNGNGVRGDLGAVIKAILMDTEARTIPTDINYYGKLREPILRLSHLWRAFNVTRGTNNDPVRNEFNTVSPQMDTLESVTGQAVLRSPSVFNFFQPTYSPAGPVADNNLVAPEFELFTEGNELATSNRIGRQVQVGYARYQYANGQTTSYLDYSYELTIADDATALVDHMDLLLLSGNMSSGLRSILESHIQDLPTTEDGLSQRIRDAITLIMASPDYLVQM